MELSGIDKSDKKINTMKRPKFHKNNKVATNSYSNFSDISPLDNKSGDAVSNPEKG